MSGYSGIILADGDGTRLTLLTRRLAGDERPKQFCQLIGEDSLLGQTRRLEQLIRRATPELYEAFAPLRERLGTPWEEDTARAVYGPLPSTDLSRHVFQACAESLAVLPVSGVGWTDLGDPARVHEAQARLGWQPATA